MAANNIYGDIDVYIKNQLKLNTDSLSKYKNDIEYKEKFKILDDNKEVYCLNYSYYREMRVLHKLPDSVHAIMELKFVDYNACCEFYKQISMVSGRRNYIWNGFQEGISGMQQLESELDELLLKQYEV